MMTEKQKKALNILLDLTEKELFGVMDELTGRLRGNGSTAQRLALLIAERASQSTSGTLRWKKVEHWMEKRLLTAPHLTPKRLAFEYRYYARINRKMSPLLIGIAQKVKDRIRKRSRTTSGKRNKNNLQVCS